MRLPHPSSNGVVGESAQGFPPPGQFEETRASEPTARRRKTKISPPETNQPAASAEQDALKLLLDTALDAVVVMTSAGTIAEWNRRAEEIFGWTKEEVLGRPLAEVLIPEPLRPAHYEGMAHYLKTGEGPFLGRRLEVSALNRDGKEIPVELSISSFRWNGKTAFLGFMRDISGRLRRRSYLENQARSATLLHQLTSFAAQSASVEDALRQCLSAVCEMTGWPAGHAYLPTHKEPLKLVSSVWHCPPGEFKVLRELTESMEFAAGIGFPGHIWDRKEPVWVTDVHGSENFLRARAGHPIEVKSAFGFPITSGDQIIAILEFFNDHEVEPDNFILLTARALGDQVGRVLERKLDAERQHSLLAELNHRVKNMLAVVVGIASQTARNAPSLPSFQESFTGRLMSLSRTYSLMTSTQWQRTQLKDLIAEVLAPHADAKQADIRIEGPPVTLTPKMTLAMGMILHELLTNALKHGALSAPAGRIDMTWRHALQGEQPVLELNWRESGEKPVIPPKKPGFGMKLIETSVRHELRGALQTSYESHGVVHKFTIPWQGD
jgi:PAS domain S-box-containing protein